MNVKPIDGFPGYSVSDDGRVFSAFRGGRELKQQATVWGYKRVTLFSADKKPHYMAVHRLVAKAFIPNPNNYAQVNHKDENRVNNHADNLEWCTCSYNINYGHRNETVSKKLKKVKLETTARKVAQIDAATGAVVRIWESVRAPEYELGIAHQNIIACCTGRRKTRGGYKWEYA